MPKKYEGPVSIKIDPDKFIMGSCGSMKGLRELGEKFKGKKFVMQPTGPVTAMEKEFMRKEKQGRFVMENDGSEMLEWIMESYPDEKFIIADGFDAAIIGVDINSMKLIYSVKRAIEILQEDRQPDDEEDSAADHFFYNVAHACVGPDTPIWCDDRLDKLSWGNIKMSVDAGAKEGDR